MSLANQGNTSCLLRPRKLERRFPRKDQKVQEKRNQEHERAGRGGDDVTGNPRGGGYLRGKDEEA